MIVLELLLGLLVRFLAVAPFILLFWWLRQSAKKETPRQNGAVLEFPVSKHFRILFRLVVLALTAFILLVSAHALRSGGLYAILIPLSVLIAILAASPRPVTLEDRGIRQRNWFGTGREITWAQLGEMHRGRRTGATYIRNKEGGRITFSPLLVSQSIFEKEVRSRKRQSFGRDEHAS